MVFFIIFIIFIIVIIFLFSSPKLSPIPYFPSQKTDLPKIIKALDLKNNQTVLDLGAGDGIVIFSASETAFQKKLNTKFIAVEINPILLLILNIRRLFHSNRKNIKIVRDDIFKFDFTSFMNFKNFITIYLYISPWFINKVIKNVQRQILNFSVISYMYEVDNLKNKEIIQGKNKIFTYI